ncbi:MAG: nucleoside hydrolase [bacterium]|nr:nucleoside hydrolase [bacterium]
MTAAAPRKIIIDTDPGIDDAMAIYFALKAPELDVIGLTTIFGNVHTSLATTNALRLLEIAGRTDIPVAKGADHPIASEYEGPVPFVHGGDGQGNLYLDPPTTSALAVPAAQWIVEQVMAHPGEITLVPVGPLTNIALALHLEPRIVQHVREVVLMGGNAIVPGNATPAAEANIHNDPEAADIVFGAAWNVTMIGLDVTHRVNMTREHIELYGSVGSPLTDHVMKMLPVYQGYFERAYGIDGIYVHDSSAVAYVIDPTLFRIEHWPIRVETMGRSRGKTWPALGEVLLPDWKDRPKVGVAVDVDSERLIRLEHARMLEGSN